MPNNVSTAICKQHAGQCDRRAILTTDETLRHLYRDLAEQWRNMANDADRFDRLTINPHSLAANEPHERGVKETGGSHCVTAEPLLLVAAKARS